MLFICINRAPRRPASSSVFRARAKHSFSPSPVEYPERVRLDRETGRFDSKARWPPARARGARSERAPDRVSTRDQPFAGRVPFAVAPDPPPPPLCGGEHLRANSCPQSGRATSKIAPPRGHVGYFYRREEKFPEPDHPPKPNRRA